MNIEKDPSKLTSLDEHGSRIGIIPAEVRGPFRNLKTRIHFILLVIFLALPWIHFKGHQVLLFNIPQREFNFFGLLFRAHDAPLFFLVLAILVMGLAFATAIWGRIWCGWACPQTVFIDFIYRRIEIWIEGNYIQRRKLRQSSSGFKKSFQFLSKWFLFAAVSSLIAHSFIAYFVGSNELLKMMKGSPTENWDYFMLVLLMTALLLFNFGWFREQFCVIMCPYGRIQSVLLESNSLAVVYDTERGEPRRRSEASSLKKGDCVSCNRCVEVCPTGIDIRNGLQMECISCTACIDACNEIMTKVQKPKGLISYRTLNNAPMRFFKIKTVFYGFSILISVTTLAYNLATRDPLNIALLRAVEAPYTLAKTDSGEDLVRNHFRLHLTNQTDLEGTYRVELSNQSQDQGYILTLAQNPIVLKRKSSETLHLFIQLLKQKLPASGHQTIQISLVDAEGNRFQRELIFIGPAHENR